MKKWLALVLSILLFCAPLVATAQVTVYPSFASFTGVSAYAEEDVESGGQTHHEVVSLVTDATVYEEYLLALTNAGLEVLTYDYREQDNNGVARMTTFLAPDLGEPYLFVDPVAGKDCHVTVIRFGNGAVAMQYSDGVHFGDTGARSAKYGSIVPDTLDGQSANTGGNSSGSGNSSGGSADSDVCPICHGSGVCQSCYGTGGVSYTNWTDYTSEWVDCKGCDGSRECKYCHGTGKQ